MIIREWLQAANIAYLYGLPELAAFCIETIKLMAVKE